MKQPNIVFLFSDQQRWDTIGAYGQEMDVTPNLDKMAKDGVLFNNAFTCQPVCGPARSCLQTGLYATQSGSFKNGIGLDHNLPKIADLFNDSGYETAYVGKWHLATTHGINDYAIKAVPQELRGGYKDFWIASDVLEFTSHGYDGYMYDIDSRKRDFKGYRGDATTDFALEYLNGKKSDKPFFLMVSYIEPHHQNDRECYEGPNGSKERFKDFKVPGDLEGTEGNWRENYPDYLGCCNNLDENVGRIREELKLLGLEENTIIVYTSDHGSHFKTRNSEYKRSCHDGSVHIPLIVCGPGFSGGKVVDDMVSLIDLPKTFLDVSNIKVPSTFQGNSLKELVNGSHLDWPKEVFIQISESHVGRAIRTDRWKFSVRAANKDGNDHPGSDEYTEDFLYDLRNDPHEKENLIDSDIHDDIKEQLTQTLKRRMVEAGEKSPEIVKGNR
ncbi:MAG: sulfatase-like hydrolase/transferase [Spirochaetaceae bacterium]